MTKIKRGWTTLLAYMWWRSKLLDEQILEQAVIEDNYLRTYAPKFWRLSLKQEKRMPYSSYWNCPKLIGELIFQDVKALQVEVGIRHCVYNANIRSTCIYEETYKEISRRYEKGCRWVSSPTKKGKPADWSQPLHDALFGRLQPNLHGMPEERSLASTNGDENWVGG